MVTRNTTIKFIILDNIDNIYFSVCAHTTSIATAIPLFFDKPFNVIVVFTFNRHPG